MWLSPMLEEAAPWKKKRRRAVGVDLWEGKVSSLNRLKTQPNQPSQFLTEPVGFFVSFSGLSRLRPGLDMRKDEKSPRSARWVGTVSSMVKVPHWVPTDSWVSAARVDWKMIELQLQAFKHLQTTSNETQECVEGWQAVTSGLQGLGIGKATMCSGFDPKVWAHVKWWYV